jgi:hypothetical protein
MQKAKSSPVKLGRSPTKKAPTLEDMMPLEKRVTMLMDDPNVSDKQIQEYKDTELLRRSVTDVKMRAATDAARRKSPDKSYSGVKSKVAGNMKSIKKAKKTEEKIAINQYIADQVVAGNHAVLTDGAPIDLYIKSSSPGKRIQVSGGTTYKMRTNLSPERTRQIEDKQRELEEMQSELNNLRHERLN